MGRAVQQDPLNATWHGIWAAHLCHVKRFDQAIEAALRATELEPNYFVAQHILGDRWLSTLRPTGTIARSKTAIPSPWCTRERQLSNHCAGISAGPRSRRV
jgi:hypothetical protein